MNSQTPKTTALNDSQLAMVTGGRNGRGLARLCDDICGFIGRLFREDAPVAPIEGFISNPPL